MSADPHAPAATTVEGFVTSPPVPVVPVVPGYEVLELVGRGGMGKVYRARHVELNRTVAIKLLLHEPDDKLLARFREETRAVAKLQHQNIAQLFESGTADGRPFYSQEFVEGGTLARKFAGQPQDPRYAAEVVGTIARAVQHSHDHGILHRDLKPGNVLLTADGTPKVTDFGLAKELAPPNPDGSTAADGLTRTGEILGTPSYMPPEQASGVTSHIGPPADVYALGAILYEALTGRPPFQSPEPLQTLLMVLSMDPVPPRTLLPKLPRDLDTICLKCLEKSPKKRYPTAAALADDLDRFRRGEPIVARPVGWVERAGKWARRKKAAAALVGVSAAFALAVVAATVWLFVTNARLTTLNSQLETAKSDLERSNTDLTAAKAESDRSFVLAQGALDRVVKQLSLHLFGVPRAEGVMRDANREAAEFYRQLMDARPGERTAVYGYADALINLIQIERALANKPQATATRAKLDALLDRKLADWPDDERLAAARIRSAQERMTELGEGSDAAALAQARGQFIRLADDFARRFPAAPDVSSFLVFRHIAAATEAGERDDYTPRRDALVTALAAARQFRREQPANKSSFILLTLCLSELGMVEEMRADLTAADEAFAEAEQLHADAGKTTDDPLFHKTGLSDMKANRGRVAAKRGLLSAAAQWYAEVEGLDRELVLLFPLDPYRKLQLADALSWRAILTRKDDPERAKKWLDEATDITRKLVAAHPKNENFAFNLQRWEALRKQMDPPPPEKK